MAFPLTVSSASDAPAVPQGTRLELPSDLEEPPKPWADWPKLGQSLGERGWRQSTEPLCEDAFDPQGFDLWSDERGVFVLAWRRCRPELLDRGCTGDGTSVWQNDGTGWQRFFGPDLELRSHALHGQPGGAVYLTADSCALLRVDDGEPTCVVPGDEEPFVHFAAVDEERAYLTHGNEVWSGQDGTWELLETLPRLPQALWANEEVVVVAVEHAVYVRGTADTAFHKLPGAPAGSYTAAWGFGAEDLWLANANGWLVHWDGNEWRHQPSGSIDGIAQLWGSEGVLFFRSQGSLGRLVTGQPEMLLSTHNPSGFDPRLGNMWGNRPNEAVLTLASSSSCADLLVFDGTEFHRF